MGRRGPLPLPNSERVATHASRQLDAPDAVGVAAPPVHPTWHPEAKVWFKGLIGTPQSRSYTTADWVVARAFAAALSGAHTAGDYIAIAKIVVDAAGALMLTRSARLAARLDIDEPAEATTTADVVDLPSNAELRARTFGEPS